LFVIYVVNIHPIKQDTFGRYCLNDLHKASGGDPKHGPDRWYRLDSTQEVVDTLFKEAANSPEVEICSPAKVRSGRYGGTFVVKELVYAANLEAST